MIPYHFLTKRKAIVLTFLLIIDHDNVFFSYHLSIFLQTLSTSPSSISALISCNSSILNKNLSLRTARSISAPEKCCGALLSNIWDNQFRCVRALFINISYKLLFFSSVCSLSYLKIRLISVDKLIAYSIFPLKSDHGKLPNNASLTSPTTMRTVRYTAVN